jgi:signal transduction histidine kinase
MGRLADGETNASQDPQGVGLVCVFLRDLTQRRRAEEDTRVALARKAELYELRSRFIAMASHEFRTPLTSILSSVELMRHYRQRMAPEELDALLGSVEDGVQRMTRMLDRVLVIGKADADRMEFSPRTLHLPDFCHELALEAKAQVPHALGRVVESVQATEGFLDDELLRHILGNLLSNALKYSPAGGDVRFDVRADGDAWVFTVRDQGIGIPPTDLPHVFASFHRCSNASDIPGTGLGLAIVQRAVTLHSGTVTVESPPGQGTVFTVRLPRVDAPRAEPA